MEPQIAQRLVRAKELLRTVRHAALATVNEDGSPHNTPIFSCFDDVLAMYWSSSPESLHSRNIERTGQGFIVLYDSMGQGGGLYMACAAKVLQGAALEEGLHAFNTRRAVLDRPPLKLRSLQGDNPQRLYKATPERLWINYALRDEAGMVIRDVRHPITLSDLL